MNIVVVTDYGIITLLYQDDMGGLEVKAVDGSWHQARPIPGAVLINVGDLLELCTSGQLPATMHRVVVPEEEIKRRVKRQSIAFFVHPDSEAIICPLAGFKGKQSKLYEPISSIDYVFKRLAENSNYK